MKSGQLVDVTHKNASSVWLEAPSSVLDANADKCCIYRHMGDIEFAHLMSNGTLPDTQPYQTITRGPEGRSYCESYLRGTKKVDSDPTTVVEFICDKSMIDSFFAKQHKPEKGCISHGLGDKAGRTLSIFNESLALNKTIWRIVLVKRRKQ